ncbi:hypothetical protein SUGI_0312090 [Cryptomeria japonica]|nr:hypothetical protein SUGI_0312090 [Cryptomeria japonica]
MVGVCSVCLTKRLNQLLVTYSCEKYSSPRSPFNLKIRTGDVAGNKMSGGGIEKSGVPFQSLYVHHWGDKSLCIHPSSKIHWHSQRQIFVDKTKFALQLQSMPNENKKNRCSMSKLYCQIPKV